MNQPKEEAGKKRLQVNVELQDNEVDRFLLAQEKLRLKTKAAAGYVMIMNQLDEIVPPQLERLATA